MTIFRVVAAHNLQPPSSLAARFCEHNLEVTMNRSDQPAGKRILTAKTKVRPEMLVIIVNHNLPRLS